MAVADATDEYVARIDGMGVTDGGLSTVVVQVDGDVDGVLGHGHEKHVLERTAHIVGFFVTEPFLEQGGEGIAVDDGMAAMVADNHLAVTFYGDFCQMVVLAIPTGQTTHAVQGNLLVVHVATEDIVQTEGVFVEIVFKTLRMNHHAQNHCNKRDKCLFHRSLM